MSIASTLDRFHSEAKESRWLWLFSVFCRFALAAGFIPAGIVKITGERFASGLSVNHPMGHYLEALHQTGYYYTFIGIVQIAAAIMLLVPRTVTLGAFLYFPVILNICILTFATRFDGSLNTAPLMVLANLFVLGWNYEKWKYILPGNRLPVSGELTAKKSPASDVQTQGSAGGERLSLAARSGVFIRQLFNDKFPTLFFAGVLAAVVFFAAVFPGFYSVKPRNSLAQCLRQFKDSRHAAAGEEFCGCIHKSGEPLGKCLDAYDNAPDDSVSAP